MLILFLQCPAEDNLQIKFYTQVQLRISFQFERKMWQAVDSISAGLNPPLSIDELKFASRCISEISDYSCSLSQYLVLLFNFGGMKFYIFSS